MSRFEQQIKPQWTAPGAEIHLNNTADFCSWQDGRLKKQKLKKKPFRWGDDVVHGLVSCQFLPKCPPEPWTSTSVNVWFCHASTRGGFKVALELWGLAVASCRCVHGSLSELQFRASVRSRKATLKVLCFLAWGHLILYSLQTVTALLQIRHSSFAFMKPGRMNAELSFHSSLHAVFNCQPCSSSTFCQFFLLLAWFTQHYLRHVLKHNL